MPTRRKNNLGTLGALLLQNLMIERKQNYAEKKTQS
jgi:hypothetical protein